MTGRLHAWLRQAHSDLAMAAYASEGGFHAQACYHRLLAALALAVARAVVGFADQQLWGLDGRKPPDAPHRGCSRRQHHPRKEIEIRGCGHERSCGGGRAMAKA